MKQNVTMQDIADRFGVSKVTISKALNDKEGVSNELKNKIILGAEEMGYRMNAIAQSLKTNSTFNIGVIVPEQFTNTGKYKNSNENVSFYMDLYQEVSKALYEENYSAILHILSTEDEEESILPKLYRDNKVDGFIVLGQVAHSYVEKLQDTEFPIVYLDFYDEYLDRDSITSDNFAGCYMITNYLIHNAHRDIAFVGNLFSTSSIQDRFLGYYKSLLEHKIQLPEDYIISDRDEKGRYIELVYPKKMPTAFVCNCDQVANIVIRELQQKGYCVPEDISVVGFDNSIYSAMSIPTITTVEVDMTAMVCEVVRLLLKKLENIEYKSGKIAIKGKLVIKDSVAEKKKS
ncbi:MAG: substrate-binding domain-containing protein [Lachnotalea sp.]